VINMDSRPGRWDAFNAEVAGVANWPFRAPVRFSAVDGALNKPPEWWTAGRGAWGCANSHIRILEEAMRRDLPGILVFEDDVVFSRDFSKTVSGFLCAVPDDWHQLYLGGQHLRRKVRQPRRIARGIYQAFNINRLHAYALHRRFYEPLHAWLTDWDQWRSYGCTHIDYRVGRLHETGKYKVYTPPRWLVGQNSGDSDTSGSACATRFWKPASVAGETKPPLVLIVGMPCSGAPVLAHMLVKLGLYMGDNCNAGCESPAVIKICERAYPNGSTTRAMSRARLISHLKQYIFGLTEEALCRGTLPGISHPLFCAMKPEIVEACCSGVRIIHIDRPLEASKSAPQKWLYHGKQDYFDGKIDKAHILNLEYAAIIADPAGQLSRIAEFLGIAASRYTLDNAAAVVKSR